MPVFHLDYVYFDTEPMQDVKKGDLLDFLKVERFEPIEKIELKKLSSEKIKNSNKWMRI